MSYRSNWGRTRPEPAGDMDPGDCTQLSIESLHTCLTCEGRGVKWNHETQETVACRVCEGSGQVRYDPEDQTIPY